jgi:hypothetical protein
MLTSYLQVKSLPFHTNRLFITNQPHLIIDRRKVHNHLSRGKCQEVMVGARQMLRVQNQKHSQELRARTNGQPRTVHNYMTMPTNRHQPTNRSATKYDAPLDRMHH